MKNMKKLLAVLFTMIMALGMVANVSAKDSNVLSHTYKAFQIFSGTQAADSTELGQIEWGDGVKAADLLVALRADATIGAKFTDCTTAAEVAEVMSGWADDSADARAFAKVVDAHHTGPGYDLGATISAGYYLIVDRTDTAEGVDAVKNLSLLQLTKKGEFAPTSKVSIPEVEKKVQENSTQAWGDVADYNIGDKVPFKLTATLGADISAFDSYKLVFHDTLSNGLSFDAGSVKVYVGNSATPVTSGYEVANSGANLKVTIDDVKAAPFNAGANTQIRVEYTATLNGYAVVGNPGNPNEVYLEYSNNPNHGGSGETGKTPEDKVTVFTYKFEVSKVDKDEIPLDGAGFTLYKKTADNQWAAVGEELKTGHTFIWDGLDAGDYKLVETTVPSGYNKASDTEFTIVATIDAENQTITELVVKQGENVLTNFTTNIADGSIKTTVKNIKGATLPETGGMGTKLFYLIGAVLMIGAAVLLITKRRMSTR